MYYTYAEYTIQYNTIYLVRKVQGTKCINPSELVRTNGPVIRTIIAVWLAAYTGNVRHYPDISPIEVIS